MNFNVLSFKRVAEKCTDCTCIVLSVTFHLINQFYTSRISVRFAKAGSESLWSTTLLAWSQLCTDVGVCLDRSNSRIRDSGPRLANNFMVEWHFMCNTLIRVTHVCSSRVTENSTNAVGHSCLLFSFRGISL